MHPIPTHAKAAAHSRALTGARLALIALLGLFVSGASAQDAPADPPSNPPAEVPMDWGNQSDPRPERPARRAGEAPANRCRIATAASAACGLLLAAAARGVVASAATALVLQRSRDRCAIDESRF